MNRRMILKRLTSFPILVLTRTSMHARFSISCENFCSSFQTIAISNGSVSAICRVTVGEACNGGVQFCSLLLLGSTAISRHLYVCTSYVEEYWDVVPLKTRQIVETPRRSRGVLKRSVVYAKLLIL